MKIQLTLASEESKPAEQIESQQVKPVTETRRVKLHFVKPVVKEIFAKSVLQCGRPPLTGYSLNCYQGCAFQCHYCYAKRYKDYFTERHLKTNEIEWGDFLIAKVNAPTILGHELQESEPGKEIFISSATDCYQWSEAKYELTRKCLQVLLRHKSKHPIRILTKSPLVTRDIDLLKQFPDLQVGMSIATNDEQVKRKFEGRSPSIKSRIWALEKLKQSGIKTFAGIAPILPLNARELAGMLEGKVEWAFLDGMNYPWLVQPLFKQFDYPSYQEYLKNVRRELLFEFRKKGIEC